MLTVIKRNGKFKIKNNNSKKVYKTEYKTKASVDRKVKIMNDWFVKYKKIAKVR